jgi:cytochrome P450
MSWILFELSNNPELQSSLRAECRAHPLPTASSGNAPLDTEELSALDKLPLLDALVRETLRLHAPVRGTVRTAVKDDVIPLSTPFTDREGNVQDRIRYALNLFVHRT